MEIIPILALTIVAPLAIIFHYITKWKEMKMGKGTDDGSMAELKEVSTKLDDRVKTLERILDDEVPDWRRKSDEL